jgi:hypothetical protein
MCGGGHLAQTFRRFRNVALAERRKHFKPRVTSNSAAATNSNLQSILQKVTKETKGAEKNGFSFPLLASVQVPRFENAP